MPYLVSLPTKQAIKSPSISTMRLSFMLSTTMVAIYFVTCNASADSAQTKISMMESLDVVRSTDVRQHHATDRRFLREHQGDGASPTEERQGLSLSGLVEKVKAKRLADRLLNNPGKAEKTFAKWADAEKTLVDIDAFLKLAQFKKKSSQYDEIYNGYMTYLDLV